jgi:hypothetical protein
MKLQLLAELSTETKTELAKTPRVAVVARFKKGEKSKKKLDFFDRIDDTNNVGQKRKGLKMANKTQWEKDAEWGNQRGALAEVLLEVRRQGDSLTTQAEAFEEAQFILAEEIVKKFGFANDENFAEIVEAVVANIFRMTKSKAVVMVGRIKAERVEK